MAKSVRGQEKVRAKLIAASIVFPAAMIKALTEEALAIFAESQKQVPVDTGRLRDSGAVGRSRTGVIISYGTDYGLPVHERLEVKHTVGKAKFLEDPFLDAENGFDARMLVRMRAHAPKGFL